MEVTAPYFCDLCVCLLKITLQMFSGLVTALADDPDQSGRDLSPDLRLSEQDRAMSLRGQHFRVLRCGHLDLQAAEVGPDPSAQLPAGPWGQ